MTMTIYLYTHPFDGAPQGATLLRLSALRSLRDELAALPGVRVSPVPQGADLEVVLTNVIATDDGPGALDREGGHRILVVRLSRSGERLDFVCSDGRGQSAERQAARRIRNWVAGEDFFSSMSAPAPAGTMRAIA